MGEAEAEQQQQHSPVGSMHASISTPNGRAQLRRSVSGRTIGLLSVRFLARLRAGVGRRWKSDRGNDGGASGAGGACVSDGGSEESGRDGGNNTRPRCSASMSGSAARSRPPPFTRASFPSGRGRACGRAYSKGGSLPPTKPPLPLRPTPEITPGITPEMMITRGGARPDGHVPDGHMERHARERLDALAFSIGGAAERSGPVHQVSVLNLSFGGSSVLTTSAATPAISAATHVARVPACASPPRSHAASTAGGRPTSRHTDPSKSFTKSFTKSSAGMPPAWPPAWPPANGPHDEGQPSPPSPPSLPPMIAGAEVWRLPDGRHESDAGGTLGGTRPRPPTLSLSLVSQRTSARLKSLSPRGFARARPSTAAPSQSTGSTSSFASASAAAVARRPRTALPPLMLPQPTRPSTAKKYWASS